MYIYPNTDADVISEQVSEFICCLMKCDKKTHSYTEKEWTERWLIPLVRAVGRHPHSQIHVSQVCGYVLFVYLCTCVTLHCLLSYSINYYCYYHKLIINVVITT